MPAFLAFAHSKKLAKTESYKMSFHLPFGKAMPYTFDNCVRTRVRMSDFKKWMIFILSLLFIWVLYLLSHVLVPFLLAALLAYLGDPLVERLQCLRISRTLSVLLVFVFFGVLIAFVLVMVVPGIQRQAELLIKLTPALVEWMQKNMIAWVNQHLGLKELINPEHVKQGLSNSLLHVGTAVNWLVRALTQSSMAIVEILVTMVLIPVVTFYLMRDWGKLIDGIHSLLPRRNEKTIVTLANEANSVLSAFIRGQLLVMMALAVYYSIGLTLLGLNFSLILGVLIGLISVVPYLGSIVGILLAVITAAFQFNDGWHIVYVLLVFAIGHVLENFVLTPLLIGGRIGLHPVAVIFSILAGGVLFGFFGVLLALPVATVVMVFVRYYRRQYLSSDYYLEKGHE